MPLSHSFAQTIGAFGPATATVLKDLGHRLKSATGEPLSHRIPSPKAGSIMGTLDGGVGKFVFVVCIILLFFVLYFLVCIIGSN